MTGQQCECTIDEHTQYDKDKAKSLHDEPQQQYKLRSHSSTKQVAKVGEKFIDFFFKITQLRFLLQFTLIFFKTYNKLIVSVHD